MTCCVLSSALSLDIREIILVGTEAMQSTKARRRDLSENAMQTVVNWFLCLMCEGLK